MNLGGLWVDSGQYWVPLCVLGWAQLYLGGAQEDFVRFWPDFSELQVELYGIGWTWMNQGELGWTLSGLWVVLGRIGKTWVD